MEYIVNKSDINSLDYPDTLEVLTGTEAWEKFELKFSLEMCDVLEDQESSRNRSIIDTMNTIVF